jgi:glycosyltransferase involved in cell wall biosynthesis
MKAYGRELGVHDQLVFTGFIPKQNLLRGLSSAEIWLDSAPSSTLNDYSTSIKVTEYMAFEKRTVRLCLKEIRLAASEAVVYATSNDTAEYARAIAKLMDDPPLCQAHDGRDRARTHEKHIGLGRRLWESPEGL